jgi:hypothetical protein
MSKRLYATYTMESIILAYRKSKNELQNIVEIHDDQVASR